MATLTERIELLIDAKAGGAISEMKKLSAATDDSSKTQAKATGITGKLEQGLGKMGISAGAAGAVMKTALAGGAAAAAYGIARFAMDGVQSMVTLASGVRLVQQAMGGTAQQASRLVAITDDYGISAESAAKSMAFLGRSVGTDKLREFGVEVAKGADGNVNMQKTLLNVAEAYQNMEDPGERSRLVLAAFGKAGRDMIPILEQGRDGIREMFAAVPDKQILSQKDLEEARAYKLAMDNLKDATGELSRTLGAWLIPMLTKVADGSAVASRGLAALIEIGSKVERLSGGWFSPFESLPGFLGKGVDALNPASHSWGQFIDILEGGNEATDKANRSHRSLIGTLSEEIATMEDLQAAIHGEVDASLSLESASIAMGKQVEEANKKLGDQEASALDVRSAVLGAEQGFVDYGKAVEANAIAAGATTAEGALKQIEALQWVAGTLAPDSPLRVWLDQYIDRLRNGIPATVKTQVEIDRIFADMLANEPPGSFNVVGAEGAIVNRPTLALIGEAGPEALVPLNRTAGNSPLPGGTLGGGGPQVIQLVVSGRVLAEVTASEFNRAGGPKIAQRAVV